MMALLQEIEPRIASLEQRFEERAARMEERIASLEQRIEECAREHDDRLAVIANDVKHMMEIVSKWS